MKTSAVLASLLFGSFAVAAPVDRRALVYKTEIVTETVIVYTTVYDDEPVPAATTTSDGAFYEQPKPTSSAVAVPISSAAPAPAPTTAAAPSSPAAPAYTPSVPAEEPSSVFTPPPAPETPEPTPEPAPEPQPEPTPEPQPEPEAPKPTTQEAPAPAPTTAAAPAPAYSAAPASAPSNGGGAEFTNVDITIYDNNGGFGACGEKLYDDMMIVALAQPAWGASTYDTMTGEATNPWCGQKIMVEYEGNSIEAKIMDLCPGCSGNDIDLSLAAWKKLTGLDEKTRLKASWSKIN